MLAKNLNYLRKKNKESQQELANAMGIPRTTLGDYERGKSEPNINMLIKLAQHYNVSVDELIKENISHQDYEIIKNKNMRILAISVDQNNDGNIELVETKAEAGYLDSFQNPEYISELPKLAFPNMPQGTFRGFEIRGDSMLPIEPGSIIISEYVENIAELKDDKTYIVVSKSEGLVYKRVRKDINKKELLLISDNQAYLPYSIAYDEVAEVWQYYAHLSFSDSKMTFNYLIEERLSQIQRQINDISDKLE